MENTSSGGFSAGSRCKDHPAVLAAILNFGRLAAETVGLEPTGLLCLQVDIWPLLIVLSLVGPGSASGCVTKNLQRLMQNIHMYNTASKQWYNYNI
jgi:hypothetical protein